ncbi:MAG: hypothetical protein JO303_12315 [Caulobacteraceae bacterium]|nr:hypothetical protein [Caulobacteraceae bacterium]
MTRSRQPHWGGPGASHQDAREAPPDPTVKDADDPDRYSRHSRISGGGGEADLHHAHDPRRKHAVQASAAERSKS